MSRPSTRPIIVSVKVTGFEPVQVRIAADGQQGQKETMKMISFFLLMANGINTDEPEKDLVIKVSAAPFLDLTTEISDIVLPIDIAAVIHYIRFFFGVAVVHCVWQLALIEATEYTKIGVHRGNLKLLNLFLADYGLYVGMSREDLPPGEDKPWNQK